MVLLRNICAAAVLSLGFASAAHAAFPVYPDVGTENPTLVSLTASVSGDVVVYFAGQDAGDSEDLGLLINGVDTGLYGLPNHATSVGTSFDFGHANLGDTLVFFIRDGGNKFYSDVSLNTDGFNHIWTTPYAGGDAGIPAGTFAAFEDLPNGGDKDYNDETFVFTGVKGGVPEPATWAMMLVGFGGLGAMVRRRRAVALAA
jgi:uncharacterized protein DUF4114/PEP-CTERM motif-containing protein